MTSHDAAGVIHLALRSGAIVFVLLIMADGEVWWWEGLIAVLLYFVYVGFMGVNERFMGWVDTMAGADTRPLLSST